MRKDDLGSHFTGAVKAAQYFVYMAPDPRANETSGKTWLTPLGIG